jgi:alginate O-acetyltransferase complex protein AlgI
MSFNSYSFLLLFLPITLLFFYLASQIKGNRWSTIWLVGASLIFYGLLDWMLTSLLIGSILTNYTLGMFLNSGRIKEGGAKKVLCFGIICNLGVLVFFKYFGAYGVANSQVFSSVLESNFVIPIALSFFTFQQIVYLIEIERGSLGEIKLLNYFLYITFFPQLLNGPIIRPNEFFPQLQDKKFFKVKVDQLAAGLTLISCGLFKKVVLADGIARYSNSAFDAVAQGAVLSLEEAWSGALSFTLQIYFDLSGYSDIAIGLGCMFGLRLPANFESPYKASSLIDFWHRWHMTLSRFFRDYIYIPLGGNRNGALKRSGNIFMIMLVGGIWHGTGASFIVWGGAHGICLMINHFWRELRESLGQSRGSKSILSEMLNRIITFLTVAVLWIIFRAENLGVAFSMIQSLLGLNSVPDADFNNIKISEDRLWFLLLIVWFGPNMKEIMSSYFDEAKKPDLIEHTLDSKKRWYHWHPNTGWASLTTVLFIMSLLELAKSGRFIYFQF